MYRISQKEEVILCFAPEWPLSPSTSNQLSCGSGTKHPIFLLGWESPMSDVRRHHRCYDNQRLLQELRQWPFCRVMSLRTMLVLINGTYVEISLDSLTQAGIIFIMGVAVIITNVLVIATLLNFRGEYRSWLIEQKADILSINRWYIKGC